MRRFLLLTVMGLLAAAGACRRETPSAPGKAAESESARIVRLRNVAVARIEAEEHAEALATLEELRALLPEEPMVPANEGLIALRENRLDDAVRLLDEAARLAPDDPDVANLRAQAAVFGGDDDRARRILVDAVARNPKHLLARWALLEILQRQPGEDAAAEAVRHLRALLELVPRNVVVRLALARRLLETGDLAGAPDELDALERFGIVRSPQAREFLARARTDIGSGDARAARAAVIALDNVLKPERAWQESLAELRGPPVPVANPVWSFIASDGPEPETGPQPLDMSYEDVTEALGLDAVAADAAVLVPGGPPARPILAAARDAELRTYVAGADDRYGAAGPPLSLAPAGSGARVTRLLAMDWNDDRLLDLVAGFEDGSVRFIASTGWGTWDAGAVPVAGAEGGGAVHLLLAWDADQDGDLDVLVGRFDAPLALLRNHGDGTFDDAAAELGLTTAGERSPRDAAVTDLDDDGDLDLLAITADREMIWYENLRSGVFARAPLNISGSAVNCVDAGDYDNDGWFDPVFATTDGACAVGRNRGPDGFDMRDFARIGEDMGQATHPLDFDNDGWLDVLVLAAGTAFAVRNKGGFKFEQPPGIIPPNDGGIRDVQIIDLDGDGDLDLFVVFLNGHCALWDNAGGNAHGWQEVRLEAVLTGGRRNNSFGVGGTIELRAGGAYQKRLVRGPVTHFGLGTGGPADAIRAVWPNGVPQNVILPEPDQLIVEAETLKGSCPYLLAFDGARFEFVTDLLWRSPLGMKVNAQTVASVVSTEDFVRIEGGQLRPRNGRYELEVTAALWETMFFDEIALLAVDHPADVEVFVDERFVAPEVPPFEIHAVDRLRRPLAAVDDRGRDVLEIIAERDGRRLGGFAEGPYQGVAEMHDLVLDLGPWPDAAATGEAPDAARAGTAWGGRVRLIASGWTMPTDTSINVALAQGDFAPPQPLNVAVADGAGEWIEVVPNAGFPAGKLKTIVLDLTGRFPTDDHRVRLRTNLEIYWDRIAFALGEPDFRPEPRRLSAARAALGYIGFPEMRRRDERSPFLPDYTRPTRTARWRDLEGYCTRYGDVGELLRETDDRFVIMNAGDVIDLAYEAGPPPPDGWTRDFILFSDGWVKDGDLNTAASATVGPLPFHGMSGYPDTGPEPPAPLRPEHPDWQRYQTRYVTGEAFRERMRNGREGSDGATERRSDEVGGGSRGVRE